MQKKKTLSFLLSFFAVLLLREKQKKPFVFPTFFAYVISRKRRENQRKKIHTNMFLANWKLTYQNIGKSEQR